MWPAMSTSSTNFRRPHADQHQHPRPLRGGISQIPPWFTRTEVCLLRRRHLNAILALPPGWSMGDGRGPPQTCTRLLLPPRRRRAGAGPVAVGPAWNRSCPSPGVAQRRRLHGTTTGLSIGRVKGFSATSLWPFAPSPTSAWAATWLRQASGDAAAQCQTNCAPASASLPGALRRTCMHEIVAAALNRWHGGSWRAIRQARAGLRPIRPLSYFPLMCEEL